MTKRIESILLFYSKHSNSYELLGGKDCSEVCITALDRLSTVTLRSNKEDYLKGFTGEFIQAGDNQLQHIEFDGNRINLIFDPAMIEKNKGLSSFTLLLKRDVII